jgi:DNA-binding transcriptional LysR family regulator
MHQIRYALAVAHHLGFTKAAEACGTSQPALSKGVKSLEAELGQPLFHREGKRVIVSEFGRSMLPHLEKIAEEAELARSVAENFRLMNKVPVKLGVLSTIGPVRMSRFLAHFHGSNPGVELAISEKPLDQLVDEVSAGELDFAVISTVSEVPANLGGIRLYEERYVVVLPPDHPLAAANGIALSDLSGVPYVDRLSCEMREMVMAVCGQRNVEIYARFRSEREDWVQSMVNAGIGFAFMPEYSVTVPGIIQRPLVELSWAWNSASP